MVCAVPDNRRKFELRGRWRYRLGCQNRVRTFREWVAVGRQPTPAMEELEREVDVAVKLEACIADNDNPARVQAFLEKTISPESQDAVSAILEQVSRLSVAEKLLLYLRLPSTRPDTSPQADRCSRGEMQRGIAWVRTHLAPQPAVSLPKQHVYREYTAYAARQGVKPVSSADFGKAVKAAFPAVRPRRLGVRGQSRYCYAGVGKATTLATPTLPGETICERKSLCKRPSTDVREFIDFSAVASRPASVEPPIRKPARTLSTDIKPKSSGRKTQRFVPIGPKDSSAATGQGDAVTSLDNLLAAGAASPDLDAELLQYFSTPRPETAAPPTDDKLWRLRRVLERSLDPPTFAPPLRGPAPTPPSFDFGPPWGGPSTVTRGYQTNPPSPVPIPLSGRGYLTAPPSPVPAPTTGRGYLTAPPSPNPAPFNGRGYATAPPSPGAWSMGVWPSWRSQSVPVEPAPTPVPTAFRDFAPVTQDGFFGAWDESTAFSGQPAVGDVGPQFDLVCRPTDINTPLLDIGSQGLEMGSQGLDISSQDLGMSGQELNIDNQLFGDLKQSLTLSQDFASLDGETLGIEGQFLGVQGQQMEMDVISYGLAPDQTAQGRQDAAGRRLHCGRRQ